MNIEDKEIAKLHDDIVKDVNSLVEKYVKITDWDVPENDEEEAKKQILQIIKEAISKM